MIHDEVVAHQLWPGSEPVYSDEYRNLALLDSAVNRPFQSFDGIDFYPSLLEKAAALFHSLSCNHCFYNGNKRTALITLDLFLTANSVSLLASNEEVYELAKSTASHNERRQTADQAVAAVLGFLQENTVPFDTLEALQEDQGIGDFYQMVVTSRNEIRSHPHNHPQ